MCFNSCQIKKMTLYKAQTLIILQSLNYTIVENLGISKEIIIDQSNGGLTRRKFLQRIELVAPNVPNMRLFAAVTYSVELSQANDSKPYFCLFSYLTPRNQRQLKIDIIPFIQIYSFHLIFT